MTVRVKIVGIAVAVVVLLGLQVSFALVALSAGDKVSTITRTACSSPQTSTAQAQGCARIADRVPAATLCERLGLQTPECLAAEEAK